MLLCFLATVAAASAADGSKFSISNTLGSHAVLQNPVIIWGYGVPGESISTTVAQDQVSLNVLIGYFYIGVVTQNGLARGLLVHVFCTPHRLTLSTGSV